MHEWEWKTALNAKIENENVTQKAWRSTPNGTKRQKWREMVMDRTKDRHKDFECRTENVAPNTKLEDIDSVHQTKDATLNVEMNDVVLNAKLEDK